jgi:hypothetical protein
MPAEGGDDGPMGQLPLRVVEAVWEVIGGEWGLASSEGRVMSWGSSISWVRGMNALLRASSACLRRRARRRIQKKIRTAMRMALAVPRAIPIMAPLARPGDAGMAVGSARRYFRAKTMSVMRVNPEIVGVFPGTSVIDGTV